MQRHFFKVLCLGAYLLSGLYLIQVNAVPACPDVIHYKQTDGSTVTVFLNGDEKVNWFKSVDGYTLLKNNEGTLEFAVLNTSGDLVPSGIQAWDPVSRSQSLTAMLSGIPREINYSPRQLGLMMSSMNTVGTVPLMYAVPYLLFRQM